MGQRCQEEGGQDTENCPADPCQESTALPLDPENALLPLGDGFSCGAPGLLVLHWGQPCKAIFRIPSRVGGSFC